MGSLIQARGLAKNFSGLAAVSGVTLSCERGMIHAVIGPNGAGKSTLFDSMLGLNTNYTGTIKFFDEDITKSKTYHK